MIPREAARGGSFTGAGLYYLRDKDASTKERVEFTHTENLPTDDPDLALKVMQSTAADQSAIKRQNGSEQPGRRCAKPVYTFSLSWHPEQDPDKFSMIEAGLSALEFLGLQEHETVIVAHNDEDHKHIHCIVNLVHPDTGRTGSLKHSRLKLSEWAQVYENEHGKIYCEKRVENNEKREQNIYVEYKDPTKEKLMGRTWKQWEKIDPAIQKKVITHVEALDRGQAREFVNYLEKYLGNNLEKYLEKQFREQEETGSGEAGGSSDGRPLKPQFNKEAREIIQDYDAAPDKSNDDEIEPISEEALRLNQMQDARHEALGEMYDGNHKKKVAAREKIEDAYGEGRRKLEERKAEIEAMSERQIYMARLSGRDVYHELENINLSLSNINQRQDEMTGAMEASLEKPSGTTGGQSSEKSVNPDRQAYMERLSQAIEHDFEIE